jgi:hypothetical protein
MQTIAELQKTLKMAMAGEAAAEGAKYSTGIIIDLQSPEGNVFYILGLCQDLFRKLGITDEWPAFYKECRAGYYKDVLAIARRWFGFIYINEGE